VREEIAKRRRARPKPLKAEKFGLLKFPVDTINGPYLGVRDCIRKTSYELLTIK
jgi:hypothetical protein